MTDDDGHQNVVRTVMRCPRRTAGGLTAATDWTRCVLHTASCHRLTVLVYRASLMSFTA